MAFFDDVKEAFKDGDTSAWEFWVVIAAGAVLVCLLVCLFACCAIRRRRRKAQRLQEELNKQDPAIYWDNATPSPHAVVNVHVRSPLCLACSSLLECAIAAGAMISSSTSVLRLSGALHGRRQGLQTCTLALRDVPCAAAQLCCMCAIQETPCDVTPSVGCHSGAVCGINP